MNDWPSETHKYTHIHTHTHTILNLRERMWEQEKIEVKAVSYLNI